MRVWFAFLASRETKQETTMPDHTTPVAPIPAPTVHPHGLENEHLDDQEKILAGRYDVNYPALLTKDVAGG